MLWQLPWGVDAMKTINPSNAYYIKLGSGGEYEQSCVKEDHTVRLGYNNVPFDFCIKGQWEEVRPYVAYSETTDQGAITRHINQIRAFYESDETVLWVTFFDNHLWWCFAKAEFKRIPDIGTIRPTVDGWHNTDIKGKPLEMSRLSGALLSMQGFRGTICAVQEKEYLLRKINAQTSPIEQAASQAQDTLVKTLIPAIKQLTWKDFELLTDLIFRQAGWQRLSQLGKTQKTWDMDLFSPITQERYLVQVKATASHNQFEAFQRETSGHTEYSRHYFIVHSPLNDLSPSASTQTYTLWLPNDIARLALQYGLVDWIIAKAR